MTHDPLVLRLERRVQAAQPLIGGAISLTPPIDEDFWGYRVQLGHGQAVLGFPKHGTVGVGFALEDDWNTNLPYRCTTDDVVAHILHNKRFACISDEDVRRAVLMVQEAAADDVKDPRGGVGSLASMTRSPELEALLVEFADGDEGPSPLLPCPDEAPPEEKPGFVVIYDVPVDEKGVDVSEEYYGYFSSVEQARDQYLAMRGPAYKNAMICRVVEAIE